MQSVYIELAIGLVIAFFLLSLLVSGVNEGINRVLGIRAKFLWAYLGDLIDGAVGWAQLACLTVWAAVAGVLTARTFTWE